MGITLPDHLAYVEWFNPVSAMPDQKHCMYKVLRSKQGGHCQATIIPIDRILHSIHLIPCFGSGTPLEWSNFTVLEQCDTFFVNPFTDIDNYLTIISWIIIFCYPSHGAWATNDTYLVVILIFEHYISLADKYLTSTLFLDVVPSNE